MLIVLSMCPIRCLFILCPFNLLVFNGHVVPRHVASTKGYQCIVRPDIDAVSIHRGRGRDGRMEIGLMRDRELIAAFHDRQHSLV